MKKVLIRQKRVPVRIPVLVAPSSSKARSFNAEVTNLSEGGAFINTPISLLPGTSVSVTMEFGSLHVLNGFVTEMSEDLKSPVPENMAQLSTVRWKTKEPVTGFGIQFLDLSGEKRLLIQKLVGYFDRLQKAGLTIE